MPAPTYNIFIGADILLLACPHPLAVTSKRKESEKHLFVENGCLRITDSPLHVFPSSTCLFHIEPKVVEGGLLCFTISMQVRGKVLHLSASPWGCLRLLGGRPSVSEQFFLYDPSHTLGGERPCRPASLQYFASRSVANSVEGYEGVFEKDLFELVDASGSLFRARERLPQSKCSVSSGEQCCVGCGEEIVPLDPDLNPDHYRYLEVQFRRMAGDTTPGRNVSPGSFIKALGSFLAFMTITRKLLGS